jgi:hypothetical protein
MRIRLTRPVSAYGVDYPAGTELAVDHERALAWVVFFPIPGTASPLLGTVLHRQAEPVAAPAEAGGLTSLL